MNWINFETVDNSGRIEKHLINLDKISAIISLHNPNKYGKEATGVKIVCDCETQTLWGISVEDFKKELKL